jgi:glucosamine-6-phosphate deaminase
MEIFQNYWDCDVMNRKDEIHRLLSLSSEEVVEKAGDTLIVCETVDELYRHFAKDIFTEIQEHNERKTITQLILPVGPTNQYPILAEMINEEKLPLKSCTFFFMDEYADDDEKALPETHPLSFKGIAKSLFLDRIDENLLPSPTRIHFPNENNIETLAGLIKSRGIDTCYGGIGIHGHIAFNEPGLGVVHSNPHLVNLNDYTITINAIRAGIGGNLEGFPKLAYTIGMRQILTARKIRLYCRNEISYDWAKTVLRLALFGRPGDDYPVTHIRDRDFVIITDKDTLEPPKIIL